MWHTLLAFVWFFTTTNCRRFYDYSYDEIVEKLESYATSYNKIFELQKASEKYGISFPKEDTNIQCSKQHHNGCEFYIGIITNFETWKDNLDRPQLFFSGALHGNERVGPTTLVETTEYLLSNYNKNSWITHLINSRVIVLTPMTNAHGYAVNKREENFRIDPNRDFPIDLSDSSDCMKSLTARVVNEIFREYLIQIGITYHGGQRAIAYEYGTFSYGVPKDQSPDHAAQHQMSLVMQYLGGRLIVDRKTIRGRAVYTPKSNNHVGAWFYPINTLNKLVYPVHGGMEDWAYMGSWDEKMKRFSCNPQSNKKFGYKLYNNTKTIYNDSMLRSFNFLIETSDEKIPSNLWGNINTYDDLWDINGVSSNLPNMNMLSNENIDFKNNLNDGHISRNMRITLLSIDMIQPYIKVLLHPNYLYLQSQSYSINENVDNTIFWMVSGVTSVEKYEIYVASSLNVNDDKDWQLLDSSNQRKNLNLLNFMSTKPEKQDRLDYGDGIGNSEMNMYEMFENENYGKWSISNKYNIYKFAIYFKYTFTQDIINSKIIPLIGNGNENGNGNGDGSNDIKIMIRVKCDNQWYENIDILSSNNEKYETFPSGMAPQSHVVNARNNEEWKKRNGKYFIKSQIWWSINDPIIIKIYNDESKNIDLSKSGEYSSLYMKHKRNSKNDETKMINQIDDKKQGTANKENNLNENDNNIINDNDNESNNDKDKNNGEKVSLLPSTHSTLTKKEKIGILETFSEQFVLVLFCGMVLVAIVFWKKRKDKKQEDSRNNNANSNNSNNNNYDYDNQSSEKLQLLDVSIDGSNSPRTTRKTGATTRQSLQSRTNRIIPVSQSLK